MADRTSKGLAHVNTDSREVHDLWDATDRAIREVTACPLLDGVLVEVSLEVAWNHISHPLGRKPKGRLVVSCDQSVTIHDAPGDWTDKQIVLLSTGVANVKLWIF